MRANLSVLGVFACALALGGCALPRGAALQSEVTANASSESADFAVYPVTRAMLDTYRAWPGTGDVTRYSWVGKQKGPIGSVILAGDAIDLAIWDSDDNSLLTSAQQKVANLQTMTVAPNGNIFVPYVGAVKIAGMTQQAARDTVQTALSDISASVQVQLLAKPGRRHAVDVVSGVNRPGSFPLEERDMTVLSAVSQGGGVRDGFDNPQIRLLRGNSTYAIALDKLFKSPELDTTLRAGDKILVAEDESYFLALGASDREELITFPKEDVSALDAMSLMGGLSDARANPEGILVLREYGTGAVRPDDRGPSDTRVVFTMDLTSADGLFSAGNFKINPGDLVYATESPVNNARTILSLIGASFGVARQLD
jgi:polysaccharide export outer membrane protein